VGEKQTPAAAEKEFNAFVLSLQASAKDIMMSIKLSCAVGGCALMNDLDQVDFLLLDDKAFAKVVWTFPFDMDSLSEGDDGDKDKDGGKGGDSDSDSAVVVATITGTAEWAVGKYVVLLLLLLLAAAAAAAAAAATTTTTTH